MKAIKLFLFFSILFFGNIGCKKDAAEKLLGAGLVLSVDDAGFETFYDIKDFLKNNNIRLTFYVSHYLSLDSVQKSKLLQLQADGHEIAHHTSTHPKASDYIAANGMDSYLKNEIFPVTDSMKRDGFNPIDFAYPNGDCTAESDVSLLNFFNSLRKTIGPYLTKHICDVEQIYYRYSDIKIFYGCSIDKKSNYDINEIYESLEFARNSRQTLSLYCHNISPQSPGDVYYVSSNDIQNILLKAKSLGLKFYTVSQISRKKF